jgi:hypothetical protein
MALLVLATVFLGFARAEHGQRNKPTLQRSARPPIEMAWLAFATWVKNICTLMLNKFEAHPGDVAYRSFSQKIGCS